MEEKTSIERQLNSPLVILLLSLVLAGVAVCSMAVNRYVLHEITETGEHAVNYAAGLTDGDKVAAWLASREYPEYPAELMREYNAVLAACGNDLYAMYLIAYRSDGEGGFTSVMVADGGAPDDITLGDPVGKVDHYSPEEMEAAGFDSGLDRFVNGLEPEPGVIYSSVDTGYGRMMRTWRPIRTSDGTFTGAQLVVETNAAAIGRAVLAEDLFMTALLALLTVGLVYNFHTVLQREVCGPLEQLTDYVQSYGKGAFKRAAPRFEKNNEISRLLEQFSRMDERMRLYAMRERRAALEQQRSQNELRMAGTVQNAILPQEVPVHPTFDLYV